MNHLEPQIIIFGILFVCRFAFELSSDEEAYFAWAKHYSDPNWIPGSFLLGYWEGAAARLIFFNTIGRLLTIFSFETVALAGNAILLLWVSHPLRKIFYKLGITNVQIILILFLFFFFGQNFFPGGTMIGEFTSKQISSLLVFYALFFLLEKKYYSMMILAGAASIVHIIVGGWFALIAGICLLVSRQKIQTVFLSGLIYVMIFGPYAFFLSTRIDPLPDIEIGDVNLDWIYTYFRHGKVLQPFLSADLFIRNWLPGLLAILSWVVLSLTVFLKKENERFKALIQFTLINSAIIFGAFLVAAFDKNGVFLKFYPFRSGVLLLFIVLSSSVVYFNMWARERKLRFAFDLLLILPLTCYLLLYPGREFLNSFFYPQKNKIDPLVTYVRENTPPSSVFFFYESNVKKIKNTADISFMRKAERDRFADYKFTKSGSPKLYEWYHRIKEKEKVEDDINYLFMIADEYKIDYLVAKESISNPMLEELYKDSNYYLYRLVKPDQ